MTELPVTYRGVIHPWHCDLMGHMNVVHYVSKFDDAAWQLFSMLGADLNYFETKHCGVAALQQNIFYKSELRAGNTVTIRSGVIEIKDKVFKMVHEMRNDANGELSAVMILTAVHFNTRRRKSSPFPKEIRKSAEKYFISYNDPQAMKS